MSLKGREACVTNHLGHGSTSENDIINLGVFARQGFSMLTSLTHMLYRSNEVNAQSMFVALEVYQIYDKAPPQCIVPQKIDNFLTNGFSHGSPDPRTLSPK